jgi:hypothetical protein
MPFDHDHRLHAQHHLAEIDEQISGQRSLVEQLRADGQDTAESERLLESLLEARLVALAHRRLAIHHQG